MVINKLSSPTVTEPFTQQINTNSHYFGEELTSTFKGKISRVITHEKMSLRAEPVTILRGTKNARSAGVSPDSCWFLHPSGLLASLPLSLLPHWGGPQLSPETEALDMRVLEVLAQRPES